MRCSSRLVGLTAFLLALSSHAWAAPAKIALVQYDADRHFNQYKENRETLTRFAQEAVNHDAKLIVFPEGSIYGYSDKNSMWCDGTTASGCIDVKMAAEKIPGGRTTAYWESFAKENSVYVVYNLPEIGSDGHYYNTSGVVGPDGYVSKYRKRNLYLTDQYYATAGDSPTVLSTTFGTFGIAICLDGTYQGVLEDYHAMGVNAVLLPMDWDDDPNGAFAARAFFMERSDQAKIDVFVSDQSSWDGTGAYLPGKSARTRDGLAEPSIGIDGISYFTVNY